MVWFLGGFDKKIIVLIGSAWVRVIDKETIVLIGSAWVWVIDESAKDGNFFRLTLALTSTDGWEFFSTRQGPDLNRP